MQNVKFPGLTFIIPRPQNWSNSTLKCQSALENVKCSLYSRLGVSGSPQMSGGKGGVSGGGAGTGGGGGGLMATIHNVFSKVLGGNSGEMRKQCMNLQM